MNQKLPTLFHYVHCPFCIRVRMAFGYLKISYHSQVLGYDDEVTPMKLCQKKMLPIVQFTDGQAMNESLDIITRLDQNQQLKLERLNSVEGQQLQQRWLSEVGEHVHSLCMPYWIYTPEFDVKSREYFQRKKEVKRGPFKQLAQNKQTFLRALTPLLQELEDKLRPYYHSNQFSILDILVASHIWGLYVFPEFQFSPKVHEYLQLVKQHCQFEYHQDFWR